MKRSYYSYYKTAPTMYLSGTFVGDTSICNESFATIEGMLEAMKETRIALREMNWKVWGCKYMGLIEHRIMLKELYDQAYLSGQISKDDVSIYYNYFFS